MERIRVGIVGMGLMGDLHTRVYQSLPMVDVVGVYEADLSRMAEIEKKYGVKVFDTLNELLLNIDALSVCTPDNLHKDIILEAFRNKVKVLVEKPLEVSSKACMEIIEARPDETYLMVGHILRFDPRIWHAKHAVETGEIGNILSVNIKRHNNLKGAQKIGKRTSVTWFLGIHDVDLLLWITGLSVKRISAMGKKIYTNFWDYVVSIMEMDNGAVAVVENGWIMPEERASGLDASLKIVGDKGMIEIDLTHNDVYTSYMKNGRMVLLDSCHWPEKDSVPYGDLRIEIESFIDAVRNNTIPAITGEEALEAVKIVELIEENLEGNKGETIIC